MIIYRLLSRVPFPLLYFLAWLTYLVIYFLAGYRKTVVRQNLRAAFPQKNEKELTILAKKFYRQLCEVGLEIVKAQRMQRQDFLRRMVVRNPEVLREASGGYRDPVLVLTIHQGNWDWMLHGMTAALEIPMDPVYKHLHNPASDRLMLEVRSRFGARPIALENVTREVLARRREFRCLVMVADQSPIRRERGYWTDFMHRPAAFHPGPETIARLTGMPVLFAQCRRRHRGHYEIELHPLATPPLPEEDNVITQRYVRMAERAIAEEPESWLWSNRRWKREPPPGTAAA